VNVVFTSGIGAVTLPVSCGDYDCVLIRDRKHTLARRLPITAGEGGGGCSVAAHGPTGALLCGNLNDDRWVDILDFGIYIGRFGTSPGSTSLCSLVGPHADISGDGLVDPADYTFIALNFVKSSDAACGSSFSGGKPITSISIGELFEMGMGELVVADLNRDGMLDQADINSFLTNGAPVSAIYEGPAGGLWSNPAHWSGGVVPTASMRTVITREVVLDIPNALAGEVTIIPGGMLHMAGAGALACGPIFAYEGGGVMMNGAASSIDSASIVLEGPAPLLWRAGTITLPDGGDLTLPDASLTIGDQALASLITPPGSPATLELGVGAEVSAADGVTVMADGTIVGDGDVLATPVASIGVLLPQPTLNVEGALTLEFDSITRVQLRAGDFDAVHATGAVTLGGALDVMLEAGFVPTPGSTFEILTGSAVTSAFHRVTLPTLPSGTLSVIYLSDRVRVVCSP
jgi:hypothetical protein